jgi:hypothetical protein
MVASPVAKALRNYRGIMSSDNRRLDDHSVGTFGPPPGCWRMTTSAVNGAQGVPQGCPLLVTFRGQFHDGQGRAYEVESCAEHLADLVLAVPVEGGGLRSRSGNR